MAAPKASKGPGALGKIYLFLYNAIQVVGWSHVLVQTVNFYLKADEENKYALWELVNPSLLIFQTAAVFEVLNVALGLVNTNLVTTMFQVASRVFIVWLELYFMPGTRLSVGLPLLLFAWCVTEIIRYSYYAFGIANQIPYPLSWARYTFFYALYPIGVTGEILVVLSSIPIADQNPLHVALPNAWNVTLSYEYFLYFILVTYAIIFPRMYGHMIHQRRKVLGRALFDAHVKTK